MAGGGESVPGPAQQAQKNSQRKMCLSEMYTREGGGCEEAKSQHLLSHCGAVSHENWPTMGLVTCFTLCVGGAWPE
ncbi:hypothetical protein EYF80_014710 [Liparis tanakae]|uniref:Uncharacterized protein n=1 Tax=Liparis tanakae TaxID=230148 RepID=A0A4Z2IBY6_9TELE|nr:hypothetical protein EYF80_014710 [Liparis tanakae]